MKLRTLICTIAMTLFVALGLGGSARAQTFTFTLLHSFDLTDGFSPSAGLVQATDGGLYGTTTLGGANTYGTIFSVTPSGVLTTLHNFDLTDGEFSFASPVQATNGNLYGTTVLGGVNRLCKDDYGNVVGCGTVYKITPSGKLTTLYSFCSQSGCADGARPSGLLQAINGNFYGSTSSGGVHNLGTIFKITVDGALTTLHSFDGTDGEFPNSGVIQATDGNFYGTADEGGTIDPYAGTVFKMTPAGTLTTLHSFNGTDGLYAAAGLVQGTDGNFYGSTVYGGTDDDGTIFKITPGGVLTTLHSFDGTDGDEPSQTLVQATDGNFYGTTQYSNSGDGTIFSITSTGELTTLLNFDGSDGESPYAPLVQDTNGMLYGTTGGGGASGYGTVFSISVGLGPFVETLPSAGKAGASVKILGTDLTGATSVTFNGTPATFVVGSASGIVTTVPAGATTGTVAVTTPSGTLSSNVPFRVVQ